MHTFYNYLVRLNDLISILLQLIIKTQRVKITRDISVNVAYSDMLSQAPSQVMCVFSAVTTYISFYLCKAIQIVWHLMGEWSLIISGGGEVLVGDGHKP